MPVQSKTDILCAKCHESNPSGSNHCSKCGSRLYILCHSCGQSNQRVANKCVHCGHRLHKSIWYRAKKKLFGRSPKVNLIQIIFLILFVFAGYKLVVYFAEYQPSAQEVQ